MECIFIKILQDLEKFSKQEEKKLRNPVRQFLICSYGAHRGRWGGWQLCCVTRLTRSLHPKKERNE